MPAVSTRRKPAVVLSPLALEIDELGALEAWLAPHKEKIARIDALRKSIRARYATAASDKEFLAEGGTYDALLGEQNLTSQIDMVKLAEMIGVPEALRIATTTLEALKAFPGATAAVVSKKRTGPRPLTVFLKKAA